MKRRQTGAYAERFVRNTGQSSDDTLPGLTKKHETAFRTTIADLIAHYENEKPLGEAFL